MARAMPPPERLGAVYEKTGSLVCGVEIQAKAAWWRELLGAKPRRGRPRGTHQPRWAQKFLEERAQLDEDGYDSPVEGENVRLSDYELRIRVARWDYETAHLVHWSYDPRIERRRGADRVLKAIAAYLSGE